MDLKGKCDLAFSIGVEVSGEGHSPPKGEEQ
jgi:hypothetical protein